MLPRARFCTPSQHDSPTINYTHVCFYGALFEILSGTIYTDWRVALEAECSSLSVVAARVLKLQLGVLATPCVDHMCHNSVRWSMRSDIEDRCFGRAGGGVAGGIA